MPEHKLVPKYVKYLVYNECVEKLSDESPSKLWHSCTSWKATCRPQLPWRAMANIDAFFYGTLMAPQVLYRVIHGTTKPTPSQISRLTIKPAILPQYIRHRVRDCDYPAIVPSKEPGACVRGTYVRGLNSNDQWRLDLFEGSQYERIRLRLNLLDDEGNKGEEMEAETYVWADDAECLEDGEWDFEEFRREKMRRWVGNHEEYEEVDQAAEKKDPTGGRGSNGRIGSELQDEAKGEVDLLESAV